MHFYQIKFKNSFLSFYRYADIYSNKQFKLSANNLKML